MLKLPMGWANERSGKRSRPAAEIAARTERTRRALVSTGFLPLACDYIFLPQPGQRFARLVRVENVEVRIDLQSALEIFLCLRGVAQSFVDHACVEEKLWVLRSLLQGVRDSFGSFLRFVILE